jgi:hypothetical protein
VTWGFIRALPSLLTSLHQLLNNCRGWHSVAKYSNATTFPDQRIVIPVLRRESHWRMRGEKLHASAVIDLTKQAVGSVATVLQTDQQELGTNKSNFQSWKLWILVKKSLLRWHVALVV